MVDKMEKVWNISDHPNTKVPAQNLVLFGKVVMPGQYVKVPASRLARAHKLEKDVKDMLAFVGDQPPADYLTAKEPPSVSLPGGASRARFVPGTAAGPTVKEASVEKAPEPTVVEASEKPEEGRRNGGRSRR
jgi:hypothetical protein